MPFWKKMLSAQGRLRRRDYWLCSILLFVLTLVLTVVLAMAMGADFSAENDNALTMAQILVSMAALFPTFAISIKRCHDRNQSGAWTLLLFLPLVGLLWAFVNLGILDGTPGPNRYGPSPKGVGDDPKLVDVFT